MSIFDNDDEFYMQQALREARAAEAEGEVPIGAVVVMGDSVIARAHNQTERLGDATAHAEMLAFTAAAEYFGGKYLNDCTLYVTLEPFVMCAGRDVVVHFDAGAAEVADELLGAEVLLRAATEEEVVDAAIELFASREGAVVSLVDVEPKDCSAKATHPSERVHVVHHEVERLVSAPREACHGTMFAV